MKQVPFSIVSTSSAARLAAARERLAGVDPPILVVASTRAAADEFALAALTKLYGHTWGADEFFTAFQGSVNEKLPTFFRTHPADSERQMHIHNMQTGAHAPVKYPKVPFVVSARSACL